MAFKHTACFVFTVMIVCSAVLYPSIFSTMFRQWFGSAQKETKESTSSDLPPHLQGRGMGGMNPNINPRRSQMDPRSRAEASSSAFFAASKQGGGDAGRGRGLMGSILPVYAVGILVYFAYIMYKIFLKDKTPETRDRETAQQSFDNFQNQYGPTLERRKAEELQRTLSEELKGAKKKVAMEARAAKVKASTGTGDESEVDVAALQKRLEDTEKAMQRMMDMMNNMGVAMNQVTKQLCVEKEEEDPGQQADDEVSDDGVDPIRAGIYEPISTHSTDSEDEDISNEMIDRVPRVKEDADEDSAKIDDDDDVDEEEEVEDEEEDVVEDIGMDSKDNDTTDTVRRRNVGGSNDGESVQ